MEMPSKMQMKRQNADPDQTFVLSIYRKVPNFLDAQKLCCNLPKIQTKRPNLTGSALFFPNLSVRKLRIITLGIYADGYIVFVFPFICSFVCLFVRLFILTSVTFKNLHQSFVSKFLKWCISQQLHIRKHSYLDHSYPGGLALTS